MADSFWAHAGTHIIMLVHDLDIPIVNATPGELLRQLTLDPARNYQPTAARRPTTPTRRKQPNPEP